MGGCEGVWCSWYMTRITISTGVPHTWVINMQGDAWQLVDVHADTEVAVYHRYVQKNV